MEVLLKFPLFLRVIGANLVHLGLHLVHYAVSIGFLLGEEFVIEVISSSIGSC